MSLLVGCEPCAFWTYCGCLKCMAGFRKSGAPQNERTCRGFMRETGVEG